MIFSDALTPQITPARLWRTNVRDFALALLMLMASAIAQGQFDSASILGSIRDTSGAAIQSATVELTYVGKGVRIARQTDANGDFEFPQVRPGQFTLTVSAAGFEPASTDPFTVNVGARQRVDLTLKPGAATENVTVSGAATLLETDSSDRGTTIESREAVALPLNGRSYADLSTLVPGVRKSLIEVQSVPSRDASYDVNGMNSMTNNFQLDGIDNNAYQEANQGYSNQAVIPSPDAVQEFKVQTDNYSAEYGRTAGAVVNATTRSGGNQFHGGAYDYLRNTVLNAYGPFIGLGTKPTLVQNQFGGTFGGRVLPDKLFFFADYEGLRSFAHVLTQAVLPTDAQRAGLFTTDGTSGGTPISLQNPYTGALYSNGQLPLTDPTINQLTVKVMSLLPEPNIGGAALGSNNYQYMAPNTTVDDKGDLRFDYFLNGKQNGFARYSQRAVTFTLAPPFGGLAGGNSNGTLYAHTRQIASGYNWTPTANSILELRFGMTWTDSGKQPYNLGKDNLLADFNIPNAPTNPAYTGGLNTQTVTGFSQLGEQATSPQFTNPTQANPKVNYTWIHGRHSLKVGYEYGWLAQAISDFHPKFGSDTYAGQFSRHTGGTASDIQHRQAYNLADFFFGARSHYELNNVAEVNYLRYWHMGYVQDDFKFNSKLTINAGLRYEFLSPNYEQNNHLLNFDPVNHAIIHAGNGTTQVTPNYTLEFAGDGSLAARALINPNYTNFAPRFGFAYQAPFGLVVRAGYGLSYLYLFRFGGEGLLAYNGPDIIDATIDQIPAYNGAAATGSALCSSLTQDPGTCFRRMQDGYQTNFASAQNFSPAKAQTRYIPKGFKPGYIETYHFSLQKQLLRDTTLELSYVGNHAVHVADLTDFNQARTCTTAEIAGNHCATLLARRPIQGFTNILTETNYGFLTYNSLQARLERRYANGIFLTNAFTWSKGINNSSADLEAQNNDSALVNFANVRGDRGVSGYNQPFNNTTSIVADLPFGTGRHWGHSAPPWQQAILGNWQVTAINVESSGLPINLQYTPSANVAVSTTSSVYSVRPNLLGSPGSVYGARSLWTKTSSSLTGYLVKTNLAVPTGDVYFGSAGRNILHGPAFGQLDIAAHKSFRLWSEASSLEYRMEAFNVLNATNYQTPDGNISDGTFGAFTASSLYPSRQVQMALRLAF